MQDFATAIQLSFFAGFVLGGLVSVVLAAVFFANLPRSEVFVERKECRHD